MSLPFMKLGTLVVKTLSKPIASRLKKQAAVNPKFRTAIIGIAQANHRLTTTIQRRIYGRATNVEIRPLNEESAVQVAGDLIGELFVFAVGGTIIYFEVHRNARSEAKKEEIRKREFEVMRESDENVAKQVELLKQRVEELEKVVKNKELARVLSLKNGQTRDAKGANSSS